MRNLYMRFLINIMYKFNNSSKTISYHKKKCKAEIVVVINPDTAMINLAEIFIEKSFP